MEKLVRRSLKRLMFLEEYGIDKLDTLWLKIICVIFKKWKNNSDNMLAILYATFHTPTKSLKNQYFHCRDSTYTLVVGTVPKNESTQRKTGLISRLGWIVQGLVSLPRLPLFHVFFIVNVVIMYLQRHDPSPPPTLIRKSSKPSCKTHWCTATTCSSSISDSVYILSLWKHPFQAQQARPLCNTMQ